MHASASTRAKVYIYIYVQTRLLALVNPSLGDHQISVLERVRKPSLKLFQVHVGSRGHSTHHRLHCWLPWQRHNGHDTHQHLGGSMCEPVPRGTSTDFQFEEQRSDDLLELGTSGDGA